MMVGGAMFGYCSIGSDTKPNTPRMTTTIEITVESTGRRINLSNFILLSYLPKNYFPNAFFSLPRSP